MSNNALHFTGMKEAAEAFKELDKTVTKKIIRKGLRIGAKARLVPAAVAEAPEASGLTKSKVKLRSGGSRKGSVSVTVGVDAKDYTGQAFYAAFVLFGHRVGKRELGDARKLVPANNFLKRAFDAGSQTAVDATIDAWGEMTEQAIANKGKG